MDAARQSLLLQCVRQQDAQCQDDPSRHDLHLSIQPVDGPNLDDQIAAEPMLAVPSAQNLQPARYGS